MKTHHLYTELWLPHPREQIFDFFADPRNLQRITPDWLHFEMISAPEVTMAKGALLDYRLKLRGIPLRWQSEITAWEPPCRFVDRQTQGPYSLWLHEHTFREERHGTTVGDHVEYAARGGSLVRRFLIEPDLEKIFRYRKRILGEIFSAKNKPADL
jgi:ligand-binding SRPBCC domain-containing protein